MARCPFRGRTFSRLTVGMIRGQQVDQRDEANLAKESLDKEREAADLVVDDRGLAGGTAVPAIPTRNRPGSIGRANQFGCPADMNARWAEIRSNPPRRHLGLGR